MDIISALKSELFRPLIILFIPGVTASSPYALLLGHYIPQVKFFRESQPSAFVVIITICALAVGLILEDVGSRIEVGWDKLLKKQDATHEENWNNYLRLKLKDEIVGQRYLQTFLTRMKFELSMAPALILFSIGLFWLNWVYSISVCASLTITVVVLGLAAYLLWESYSSAQVLSNTRKQIIKAMKKTPIKHEMD
ncbi:MAG: hypothetical protein AB1757_13915 [Acidobacteriota bacterium]